MGYEYSIEHSGAERVDEAKLCIRLNVSQLHNDDFTIDVQSDSSVYFLSSRSDTSRIALAKTIEYLLATSDAVVIKEL